MAHYVLSAYREQQGQFVFAADELLSTEISSEQELIERYEAVRYTFAGARQCALENPSVEWFDENNTEAYPDS